MKKLTCIAALVPLLIGEVPAAAQMQKTHDRQVEISAREFRQSADSVHVAVTFRISGLDLDSRSSLELAPVIGSDGKNHSLRLPGVRINGTIRQKTREREMRLSGLTPSDYGYYAEVADRSDAAIEYRWAGVYQPWMADAKLSLAEDLKGCGGAVQRIDVRLLALNIALEERVEPYRPVPHVAYLTPAVEEVKRREASGFAALTFPVSRTEILPDLGDNPAELAKISELIDGVRNSRGVTIRHIDIIGWASPEGSLEVNKRLSEGRAAALRNYLALRYDLPRNLFGVKFGGENWEGLRKAMETSNYSFRHEVIGIIDLPLGEDAREARLKSLREGGPYRMLLNEVFPGLRRVEMVVDYNVSNFSLDEAREVFRTAPQNLSLNEMFILANSYGRGSQEFNRVMETAARIFPADGTANLNAAAAALSRNDLSGAQAYLSKATLRTPEYNNNMGVLSMLRGDLSAARGYFIAAVQGGSAQASANLSELEKTEENLRRLDEHNKKLGISGKYEQ